MKYAAMEIAQWNSQVTWLNWSMHGKMMAISARTCIRINVCLSPNNSYYY